MSKAKRIISVIDISIRHVLAAYASAMIFIWLMNSSHKLHEFISNKMGRDV